MSELDIEKETSRAEIASYLREFSQELDGSDGPIHVEDATGETVTIIVDGESATINPPDSMQFRVQVETESSLLDRGTDRGVTFALGWNEADVDATEDLNVE